MTIFLVLFLLWTMLLLFVVASAFIGFLRTRVPFVTTDEVDIAELVNRLPIAKKDIVYDLGSGDGRVVFWIERLSGAQVVGYELTAWTHMWAMARKFFGKYNAILRRKDFFSESWTGATIIYAYLYPPLMARVEEKFLAECVPGSTAVVRDFPFPNLKPSEIITLGETFTSRKKSGQLLNKRQRLHILIASLIPGKLRPTHEFYIYKK
jgi:hypothetical protein